MQTDARKFFNAFDNSNSLGISYSNSVSQTISQLDYGLTVQLLFWIHRNVISNEQEKVERLSKIILRLWKLAKIFLDLWMMAHKKYFIDFVLSIH